LQAWHRLPACAVHRQDANATRWAIATTRIADRRLDRFPVEKQPDPRNVPALFGGEENMSQHRSLKGASTIAAKRNVLKRFERVELLKKRGQWKEGGKVMGLPKTKPDV
jgi:small basic protein (TIGR04137 family)